MTNEEARNILHPSTTLEALAKYSDNGRLDKIKIVEEACIVACEALDKLILPPQKTLIDAAKTIIDYCKEKVCFDGCPFYNNGECGIGYPTEDWCFPLKNRRTTDDK